jgi:hypothetical protein
MDEPATDVQLSAVMRQLAALRWGSQRPVKLARELVQRLDELPPTELRALAAALSERSEREAS